MSRGRKKRPRHQLHPSEREHARAHFPPREESREDWHERVRAELAQEKEWRRKEYRPLPSHRERWKKARGKPAELIQAEAQEKFREELDEQLKDEDLGEIYERKLSAAEHSHRLRQRPGERGREKRTIKDDLGEFLVEDAGTGRGGTGRKRTKAGATRVTKRDGTVSYIKIGNDAEAIRDVLFGDGRTLENYAPALARPGRNGRSPGAQKLRAELANKVRRLKVWGAHGNAIAREINKSPTTVKNLIAGNK